ncbi:protein FAR1-RELATED SEQUENCE [Trifolium repens]|nr:protein FAR1-RELATED SEQUENCE [Trifolium repens]
MTSKVRDDVCDWPLELLKDYTSICEDNEYGNAFTFQEPQQEPLPQANTIDEWDPFEGQIFNNDDEAYEFYSVFARKNGFSIRRDHSYKSRKNESGDNPLGVYKREFVCHRAGIVKQRKVNDVESQRKRKSSRCNCSAKMLVINRTIGFEEKWVVNYFNNHHNHELLDDKEVQFLPAYRNISIVDQNRIHLLSKAGCPVSLIMRVLELEKGINTGNLPFLEKDIRNFIQSHSGIGQENDASNVLKLCKSLKDMDDTFKYDFTIDENNKLEHIIWVFGDSIRAYEAFGDVVVFDTTYRINRYDMPLGIWVGVDNHGNSIFFGCVLLRDEKIPSFTWALKSFLAFVKGKYPQTILTDQDLALKEAIALELPNTKHAFCIWHIVAKLSSWFSFPLGSRYNDFKHEFHRVYHLECADAFEQEWKLMVAQFGLSMDRHIDLLYSHRQFWALAYLKDYFFAGMTTTGRSESINAYIKRFLDVKTSLTDFVNQVGVAVKIRNQAGEEARMRQKYHNPLFRTSFPIEEHVASILTPYAFGLLQHEIELSTKYAATETVHGYIVRHHTKVDGGRLVSWKDEEKSISCSCKEFQFSGILCRHAIRAMKHGHL